MRRHLQTPADRRRALAARVREFVTSAHSQERQFRLLAELMAAPPPAGRLTGAEEASEGPWRNPSRS